MSTRTLRTRTPSRSDATSRTATRADAPTPSALPKAAAARLARLDAADLPWLGQGKTAMLAVYDGPEISGLVDCPAERVKRR